MDFHEIMSIFTTKKEQQKNPTEDKLIEIAVNKIRTRVSNYTILDYLCEYSNIDNNFRILQNILKNNNINVNKCDDSGWTPLMLASANSRTTSSDSTVKLLLEHGAMINARTLHGRTALMFASKNCNMDSSVNTIKILLEARADLYIEDEDKKTALMLVQIGACSSEAIMLFLRHGYNIDKRTSLYRSLPENYKYIYENRIKIYPEKIITHKCNICLEDDLKESTIIPTCGHTDFCHECIFRLRECPLCKSSFYIDDLLLFIS